MTLMTLILQATKPSPTCPQLCIYSERQCTWDVPCKNALMCHPAAPTTPCANTTGHSMACPTELHTQHTSTDAPAAPPVSSTVVAGVGKAHCHWHKNNVLEVLHSFVWHHTQRHWHAIGALLCCKRCTVYKEKLEKGSAQHHHLTQQQLHQNSKNSPETARDSCTRVDSTWLLARNDSMPAEAQHHAGALGRRLHAHHTKQVLTHMRMHTIMTNASHHCQTLLHYGPCCCCWWCCAAAIAAATAAAWCCCCCCRATAAGY